MISFSLQELFGINATQTAEELIIKKADLPFLTASENNRAEQLLVGIILRASLAVNETIVNEQGEKLTSESGEEITYGFDVYDSLELRYSERRYVTNPNLIVDVFLISLYIEVPEIVNSNLAIDHYDVTASAKISDFPIVTVPNSHNSILVWDSSDFETKQLTLANLKTYISSNG